MMDTNTIIVDDQINDVEYSEHSNEFLKDKRILIDSIEKLISERKKDMEDIKTDLVLESMDNFQHTPKFDQLDNPNLNNYFGRIQHWIGVVEEISENEFTAKLMDKSSPDTYEIADFDFEEISPSDINLLTNGAIFYWSVGYAHNFNTGQTSKQSLIRFRRSVDFVEEDVNEITDKAASFNKEINWD